MRNFLDKHQGVIFVTALIISPCFLLFSLFVGGFWGKLLAIIGGSVPLIFCIAMLYLIFSCLGLPSCKELWCYHILKTQDVKPTLLTYQVALSWLIFFILVPFSIVSDTDYLEYSDAVTLPLLTFLTFFPIRQIWDYHKNRTPETRSLKSSYIFLFLILLLACVSLFIRADSYE